MGLWRAEAGSDSAVLKVIQLRESSGSRWPAAPDPSHPYYWQREPLAYRSGLFERLQGIRAPGLRASFDRPDGSIALWLEDVPAPPPWTPEVLAETSRALGRAEAGFVKDLPTEPWLAHGWLRTYLELHDVRGGEDILARLDEVPQTLNHHDPHPGNILGAGGDVVIDWAYVGIGPLGLDPGVLVADGVADEVIPAAVADEVSDAVLAGYLAGLREAGWQGREEDVRYAYLVGNALRLSWLPHGDRPAWDATIALLDRWRAQARELA